MQTCSCNIGCPVWAVHVPAFENISITAFLQDDEAAPSVAEKLEELKGELAA